MKTAVVIHEENHGFIGVAADVRSAFDFLLTDHWITEKTEFPIEADDDSDFVPLEKLMERFEFDNLLDTLVFLWENNEQWFEAMFYLDTQIIYEREEN